MDFTPSAFMRNPSAARLRGHGPRSDVRLKSHAGTVNPQHIPWPRTIRPFLQPTLSTRGGRDGGLFPPGITDVGCLRGSLCFTIAAL